MRKLIILFMVISLAAGCKKNKGTCYDCYSMNGRGDRYDEVVCTDGDPKDDLPRTDAYGILGWDCTEQ